MGLLFAPVNLLAFLYLVCLLVRLSFDWVSAFARQWKPRGIALLAAEIVYTPTDPPLKALRRLIPPLRLGAISLDVGFILLLFATWLLWLISGRLAAV